MKQYQEELFIYKYRPKTLETLNRPELSIFSQIIEHNTIPNMIIYGLENSGKRTALYAFLTSRFGALNMKCTYKEFKVNVKMAKIPIFHSNHHIEIDVLSFYSHVRTILPVLLKDITQSNNIWSNEHKIIVIHHMESLEVQSQHMMRRILEIYIKNCRFIFVTKKLNKITQPLQSRCLVVSIPQFTPPEIGKIVSSINDKLDIPVKTDVIQRILTTSTNIKDAIYNLEFAYYDIGEYDNYTKELYDVIMYIKNVKNIDEHLYKYIDDYLYECLYKNIQMDTLIYSSFLIVKKISPQGLYSELLERVTYYDETINQGNREFMHVQSLFYFYVVLFHPDE